MRQNSFLALLALVLAGFIITSCNKKKERYDTSFSEDNALAENLFKNVSNIADEAYEAGSNNFKSGSATSYYLSECVDITLDFGTDPYELTIDFGDTNCLCNDGRYRKGKILVTFNGMYREPGTVISIGFDNYYVDENKVEGSMIVSNTGFNENQNIQYTVEVEGTIHKANEGGTITWNSNRTREWIKGMETIEIGDDVYLITGIANGSSSQKMDGSTTSVLQTWEMATTKALRVELNCKWIISGTLNILVEGWPITIMDFGDGACDRIATVEIDGEVYTIYMRQ